MPATIAPAVISAAGSRRRTTHEATRSIAGSRRFVARGMLSCLAIVSIAACQSPLQKAREFDASHVARPTNADPPSEIDAAVVRAVDQQQPLTEEEALAGVLDELQDIGAIDPAAQRELMDDLKRAKPEHYPLYVNQFRAALAYRNQLAARQPRTEPSELLGEATHGDDRRPVGVAQPPTAEARAVAASAPSSAPMIRPLPPAPGLDRAQLSLANAMRVNGERQEISDAQLRPAIATSDPADWRARLDGAIEALRASAPEQPQSTADVHQHFRLRVLQLLAGDQDDALRPVPGATLAQQDYWAKQLYAVSTFLDDQTNQDVKQRAAAALTHLDEARDRLSEQAALQVRNLEIVESVDGFGEYQLRERRQFRPGDQVTLYAEVENFTSTSTEKGHRTLLGTSYHLLDQTGQTIDGGQFPDVEDHCQSRRRDFHMQYGIALPRDIGAGEYELRLTVTDTLSNKLGQASTSLTVKR